MVKHKKENDMENNRTVVITGNSSGIGKFLADYFTRRGDRVIGLCRSGADNSIVCDIGSVESIDNAVKQIKESCDGVDILINNAGGGIRIDYLDRLTPEEINEVITLNLTSVIYGCHTFMDIFKRQRHGTIVNISSISARYNWETWTVYGAAKAGVANFSKGLYTELQPYGVRVSCLYLALTATGFQKAAHTDETEGTLQAEHVADAIFYACSLPEGVVLQVAKKEAV